MNWIKSHNSLAKQNDKFLIEFRLGKLTVVELYYDKSKKHFRFLLFNFGVESK